MNIMVILSKYLVHISLIPKITHMNLEGASISPSRAWVNAVSSVFFFILNRLVRLFFTKKEKLVMEISRRFILTWGLFVGL
jgi:hypothetical protein